jgi:hypothetical protein
VGGRRDGSACTVEAVSPLFAGLSLDCPPEVTNNISGVGLAVRVDSITTQTVRMDAVLPCGPPFDQFHPGSGTATCRGSGRPCDTNADCADGATCGIYCHCGFCDDGGGLDPDRPCSSDDQCDDGATCRSSAGLNQAQPNGCESFICGEVSAQQCCSAGDAECSTPSSQVGQCNLVPAACRSDSECVNGGNGDHCVLIDRPCFESAIVRTGKSSTFGLHCVEDPDVDACDTDADCHVGPCRDGSAKPTLVALFCIPPTASSAINAAGGIPGPGAATLRTALELGRQ